MIIDRSYFIGEINVPNTTDQAAGPLLDLLIQKYEKKFLVDLLGESVYVAFIQGLSVDPVPTIWMNLLGGTTYSENGRARIWDGLVSSPSDTVTAINSVGTIDLVVDRGGANDPVSIVLGLPNNKLTIPANLVGKPFTIEQRVIGELRPDEYSIAGNQLTLIGSTFNAGDTYFLKSAVLYTGVASNTLKTSPIAQYVYYWFMRNNATQTAAMGEVGGQTENATRVNPGMKMEAAWNEMSAAACGLHSFMRNNASTYGWEETWKLHEFRPINIFNI